MKEQRSIALEDYYPPFGRWFENRIYPSPAGLSIYFHDITERIKTREQLEQLVARQGAERRWLQALLKHMPTPLVLLQPHTGRVSLANEAAVQLVGSMLVWGGEGNGELGGTWSDASGRVLSPEELPQARVARGETLENLQLLCHFPSGPRWLLCNSAHLPAREDHPALRVLAFQDITQLKRIREIGARLRAGGWGREAGEGS